MRHGRKIKHNLISGIVYHAVLIAMSFILPRLYLENFGSEVNGVLSTIKQIFAYMTLLEAGVGLASTQALYKPVAENNYKKTGEILAATNGYYRRTGIIYSAIVLVIAVVYAFIIPTAISSRVLFAIVILNALPQLFSYFVQAKYRILMEVDGRKYIINNSETVLQLLSNICKILVLVFTDSLVLIQLVYCFLALLQLLYLYVYARKMYTRLDMKSKPDFKAISQRKSVLVHQVSAMVFNNTDIILLSFLCDFKAVSVYAIYNMFFSQIQIFAASITSGFNFALGQMFHTDRNEFDRCYSVYETFYIMASFIIYTLMAVFLLPVIQIYTKGINDAEYSNPLLLFLFVIMNLLANGKLPSNHVLEFAGSFRETRSHAVAEMVINIAVSVFAILKWGICGAVAGTIAALVFRGGMMIYFANRRILGRSVFETYKLWISNGAVFIIIMIIFFTDRFSGLSFGRLLIWGLVNSVWIVILYTAVNFAVQRSAFSSLWKLLGKKRKA